MRVVFVGRHRPVWKRLLLHVATLGVSRRVWLHRINRELDGHEALGLDLDRIGWALASPLVGLVLGASLAAAGLPMGLWLFAIAVGFLPSGVVTVQTTRRAAVALQGSGIPFGPPLLLGLVFLVPIVGGLTSIAWIQSRLNRFWDYEKQHPEHGVEVDLDLSDDPVFRAEIGRALKRSFDAGSRFDRTAQRREEVRRRREEVRAAGGSTPLLWWKAPTPPAKRVLHITCGRCGRTFDVVRDPFVETPIVCPGCGATEVLPSLRGDTQATEVVGVPRVRVDCTCGNRFHAVRNLSGPTTVACPSCGKSDVIAAPAS